MGMVQMLRGVYPYLPMAPNVPGTIWGGYFSKGLAYKIL